jgi:hypothetical protein
MPPLPEAVCAVDFTPLLQRILDEVLLEEDRARLTLVGLPPSVLIADAEGRCERVLRSALLRALEVSTTTQLKLMVQVEDTRVSLGIAGLSSLPAQADLDRLLSPLGGAVSEAQGELPNQPENKTRPELWIHLRRA